MRTAQCENLDEVPGGVWVKSLGSASGDCVEASHDDNTVRVRDSKERRVVGELAHVLRFSPRDWERVIDKIKYETGGGKPPFDSIAFELDDNTTFAIVEHADGVDFVNSNPNVETPTVLEFTCREYTSFDLAVRDGQFELPEAMSEQALAARSLHAVAVAA